MADQSYKIEWIGHSMLIHAKVFRVKFHNKDIYNSLINPKQVKIDEIRLYLFLINEERKYSNISKSPVWTLFNTILDTAQKQTLNECSIIHEVNKKSKVCMLSFIALQDFLKHNKTSRFINFLSKIRNNSFQRCLCHEQEKKRILLREESQIQELQRIEKQRCALIQELQRIEKQRRALIQELKHNEQRRLEQRKLEQRKLE